MFDGYMTVLYVADVSRSIAFYARLLGQQPIEASPHFGMFVLPSGARIGLWALADVEPKLATIGSSIEVAFPLSSRAAVDTAFEHWTRDGITILQQPCHMDFGYTFVGVDPDGYRLRVFGGEGA